MKGNFEFYIAIGILGFVALHGLPMAIAGGLNAENNIFGIETGQLSDSQRALAGLVTFIALGSAGTGIAAHRNR